MTGCLGASARRWKKSESVCRQGEILRSLALLAEGRLHIRKEDYWGNGSLLSEIRPGEIFGEAYAASGGAPLRNDVVAVEDSVVIFFDFDRVLTMCTSACPYHTRLIQNLFAVISEKNRNLVRKLGCLSQRTTREKLLSYLSDEAERQGSSTVQLPFNRQQLADYLAVDRSAMSAELGRMRDEGILSFHRNEFILHERRKPPL